jgi:hypothetical protein
LAETQQKRRKKIGKKEEEKKNAQVGKKGNATSRGRVKLFDKWQIPRLFPVVLQPYCVGHHAKDTHAGFDEENHIQSRVDRLVHQ